MLNPHFNSDESFAKIDNSRFMSDISNLHEIDKEIIELKDIQTTVND